MLKTCVFLLTICLSIKTIRPREISPEELLPSLPKLSLKSWSYLTHGFIMSWYPVASDEANPILGFKLKVWVMEPTKPYTTNDVTENKTIVNEYKDVDYDVFASVPTYEPMFVSYTPGPEATSAKIVGAEPGVYYQIRVQAYSAAGDGPLSDSIGLRQGATIVLYPTSF